MPSDTDIAMVANATISQRSVTPQRRGHFQAATCALREPAGLSQIRWSQVLGEETVEAAEARFEEFSENWRALYPAMIQSWENAWQEFVPVPGVPRRAAQGVLHHKRRRVPERPGYAALFVTAGISQNELAAMKVLYLVATTKRQNRENMTGRIHSWKQILDALAIHYGDRVTITQ